MIFHSYCSNPLFAILSVVLSSAGCQVWPQACFSPPPSEVWMCKTFSSRIVHWKRFTGLCYWSINERERSKVGAANGILTFPLTIKDEPMRIGNLFPCRATRSERGQSKTWYPESGYPPEIRPLSDGYSPSGAFPPNIRHPDIGFMLQRRTVTAKHRGWERK